jgi:NADPH:quinone reductase-like Zn-dependent oxidoreductase
MSERMKAVVYDSYGPPETLRLEDVEQPVPAADEVLISVRATTVTRSDCGVRSGRPFVARFFFGLRRPKRRILGMELAGDVDAVGAAVTEFAVGDRVFGVDGLFGVRGGAHAEVTTRRERSPLAHMPTNMTYEEAAAVCDGVMLALNGLRPANVGRPGVRILVYGASGSIGTAGVQLAKHFGAHVTAVCNTKNVELVRSLGADEVVDYLHEDFTENGHTYDIVFDAVGKHSFRRARRSLNRGGVYVATDGWLNLFLALATRGVGRRKVLFPIPPRYTKQDVRFLKGLIEDGEYRAVIDRIYPLEDVVEATRYVETGQKTGNVVLDVGGRRR